MLYQWKLPDVGEGIHEAEIVRWHVQPGDTVKVDQVIVEIQTDKAVVEIPSPVGGTVTKVLGKEGDVIRVGTVVIEFDRSDTTGGVEGRESAPTPSHSEPHPAIDRAVSPPAPAASTGSALATPAVRRLARELGVDIHLVAGSGDGGRILAEDVRRMASGNQDSRIGERAEVVTGTDRTAIPSNVQEERIPLKGIRRTIAEHMVRSKFTAPHVTSMDEVEVSALVAWRKEVMPVAEERGIRLTYLPFIAKAVVAALKKYPYLNASLDDQQGEIVLKKYYNLGIAVDDPEGLVVPVVKSVESKSVLDIAQEISQLTDKAHQHRLSPADLQGGTFTISNFGSFGGLYATPIINYPEVAILGVGQIQRRAVVLEDDRIEARPVMALSLTFDHRVIDGGMAGRFSQQVKQYLHNPTALFMEMI